MLYSDDHRFGTLVDRINQMYPPAGLNVTVAIPVSGGGFIATNYNNGQPNPLLLLQGGYHYQAVTMSSRQQRALQGTRRLPDSPPFEQSRPRRKVRRQ
jgi:hypothetical protein